MSTVDLERAQRAFKASLAANKHLERALNNLEIAESATLKMVYLIDALEKVAPEGPEKEAASDFLFRVGMRPGEYYKRIPARGPDSLTSGSASSAVSSAL